MKYVINNEFVTVANGPFRIDENEKASNGDVLRWLLGRYLPSEGFVLDLKSLRRLNRVIGTLEGPPGGHGYYKLEDADFDLAKSVALKMAITLTPRNAPIIEDMLNDSLDTLPEGENDESN